MKLLTSFELKLIALITMTIDHVGIYFYPNEIIFRQIGRISFIIFAFLLVEGFMHTRNKNRYLAIMLILGIIIDVVMAFIGLLEINNIYLTLSLGIMMMLLFERKEIVSFLCGIAIIWLSSLQFFGSFFVFNIMYGAYGLGLILCFYIIKKQKSNKLMLLLLVFLYTWFCYKYSSIFNIGETQLYSLIGLIFIIMYNKKRGYYNKFVKYIFYLYYPLHLMFLHFLSLYI